jgi:hypothetical protein
LKKQLKKTVLSKNKELEIEKLNLQEKGLE